AVAVGSPQALEERVPREDLAGMLREHEQQVEFAGGEGHGFALHADLMRLRVDDEAAEVHHVALCGSGSLIATEDGLDAGDDLGRGGGFYDVVVATEAEAPELVA